MARKTTPGTRSELIHCDRCGEDYSSTYKSCPFCDDGRPTSLTDTITSKLPLFSRQESSGTGGEDYQFDGSGVFDEEDPQEEGRSRGGKRLSASGNRRDSSGKGPNFAFLLSIALIATAAVIVIMSVVMPMLRGEGDPSASQSPGVSQSPAPSGDPDASQSPAPSADPAPSEDPAATQDPGGATGLSLNLTEFTISSRYPDPVQLTASFTPAGTTGTVTWTSSDPEVATVDEKGLVTGVGRGWTTITATLVNGATASCDVQCTITAAAAPSPSSSYALNREDFTQGVGDTFTLQVLRLPVSVSVTWSVADSSIASVNGAGLVTGISRGTTTVTATLSNGETLECIVRIR